MLYTKRNGLVGSSFNWKGVDVQDLLNKERRFGGIGYVAKTYEYDWRGVDVQDWLNNPEKGMINKGVIPYKRR